MNLQIDLNEYETDEDEKQGSVRYEIIDLLKQVSYLENHYEQKWKRIRRRWRNFKWTIIANVVVILFMFLLAWIFSINMVFGVFAMLICIIIAIVLIFQTIRVVIAWARHKKPRSGIYTLTEEEEDYRYLVKQLSKDKKALQDYLNREGTTVEEGKRLIEEIGPSLQAQDRMADFLYGERVK